MIVLVNVALNKYRSEKKRETGEKKREKKERKRKKELEINREESVKWPRSNVH